MNDVAIRMLSPFTENGGGISDARGAKYTHWQAVRQRLHRNKVRKLPTKLKLAAYIHRKKK